MTPPEAKLWTLLRTRPDDLKFRHQHPVGRYVFDFYCASAKLGIEIDGIAHERQSRPRRQAGPVVAEQGLSRPQNSRDRTQGEPERRSPAHSPRLRRV